MNKAQISSNKIVLIFFLDFIECWMFFLLSVVVLLKSSNIKSLLQVQLLHVCRHAFVSVSLFLLARVTVAASIFVVLIGRLAVGSITTSCFRVGAFRSSRLLNDQGFIFNDVDHSFVKCSFEFAGVFRTAETDGKNLCFGLFVCKVCVALVHPGLVVA